MRRLMVVILIAVLGFVAVLLYRSRHSHTQLQVDPHAREEIEKAKTK